MKIFVATDLHGSAFYTQQIVQKFRQSQADLMVLLGDIYNHGPRNPFPKDYAPLKVAEILSDVADKLIVVQGNCDSEVDQMISPFTFVSHNVLLLADRKLFFTHGYIYNKDNLPKLARGDVLFYGHTHQNEIVQVDGVTCVNVDSCSLPKQKASYCLVDEKGITLLDLDDNIILDKKF